MPLPPIHRRKISETTKNKFTTKNGIHDKSNSHESIDTSKKSHASNSMNTNRKLDTDKSQYSDAQEKGRYVYINLQYSLIYLIQIRKYFFIFRIWRILCS
jgi:hypothetical protein